MDNETEQGGSLKAPIEYAITSMSRLHPHKVLPMHKSSLNKNKKLHSIYLSAKSSSTNFFYSHSPIHPSPFPISTTRHQSDKVSLVPDHLRLLINPIKHRTLVTDYLPLLKPKCNLLLRVFDAVGPVTYVAAHVDGVVAADSARGGGEGVGGA